MFESLIAAVINRFIGQYVSNLEQKQLNVGIISGNIVLCGLRLKRAALDRLNLPVEVFSGHLGRLELTIPWRSLGTQPVRILIKDLFILAGPRVEAAFDEEGEVERMHLAKVEQLDAAELFHLGTLTSSAADGGAKAGSFASQLIAKILDNLQVTIENIHVRFEDSTSCSDGLYSMGVMLNGLSAVSADAEWIETFLVNASEAVNKVMKLDSFAVYWNAADESMQSLADDELFDRLRANIGSQANNYVVSPVSGSGRATIRKRFEEGLPKTWLSLVFESFKLDIDEAQYYGILSALSALSLSKHALPYRRYRTCDVATSGRLMLQFGIRCVLGRIKERSRQRLWSTVMERRRDRIAYVSLYTARLRGGALAPGEAADFSRLERAYEYGDLALWRQIARRRHGAAAEGGRRGDGDERGRQGSSGERPARPAAGLWGWLGYKESSDASKMIPEEDVAELCRAINYDSGAAAIDSGSLPRETQLFQIDFELVSGSLSVCKAGTAEGSGRGELLALVYTGVTASFTKRPTTVQFSAAIADLCVRESLVADSIFKELVTMKPTDHDGSAGSARPLCKASYDQLVHHSDADARVTLALRPLLVVVNVEAVVSFTKFVYNDRTAPLFAAIKSDASLTLRRIESVTRAGLQDALQKHKAIDLDLFIEAPMVVFPEDATNRAASLFVFDFGRLHAKSSLVPAAEKEVLKGKSVLSAVELALLEDMMYDKVNVDLCQLGLFYAHTFAEWEAAAGFAKGEDERALETIFDYVDVQMVLGLTIIPNAVAMAKSRLSVVVPSLVLSLADSKVRRLFEMLGRLSAALNGNAGGANDSSIDTGPAVVAVSSASGEDGLPDSEVEAGGCEGMLEESNSSDRDSTAIEMEAFYDALDDCLQGDRSPPPGAATQMLNCAVTFAVEELSVTLLNGRDSKAIISVAGERLGSTINFYTDRTTATAFLDTIRVVEYISHSMGSPLLECTPGEGSNVLGREEEEGKDSTKSALAVKLSALKQPEEDTSQLGKISMDVDVASVVLGVSCLNLANLQEELRGFYTEAFLHAHHRTPERQSSRGGQKGGADGDQTEVTLACRLHHCMVKFYDADRVRSVLSGGDLCMSISMREWGKVFVGEAAILQLVALDVQGRETTLLTGQSTTGQQDKEAGGLQLRIDMPSSQADEDYGGIAVHLAVRSPYISYVPLEFGFVIDSALFVSDEIQAALKGHPEGVAAARGDEKKGSQLSLRIELGSPVLLLADAGRPSPVEVSFSLIAIDGYCDDESRQHYDIIMHRAGATLNVAEGDGRVSKRSIIDADAISVLVTMGPATERRVEVECGEGLRVTASALEYRDGMAMILDASAGAALISARPANSMRRIIEAADDGQVLATSLTTVKMPLLTAILLADDGRREQRISVTMRETLVSVHAHPVSGTAIRVGIGALGIYDLSAAEISRHHCVLSLKGSGPYDFDSLARMPLLYSLHRLPEEEEASAAVSISGATAYFIPEAILFMGGFFAPPPQAPPTRKESGMAVVEPAGKGGKGSMSVTVCNLNAVFLQDLSDASSDALNVGIGTVVYTSSSDKVSLIVDEMTAYMFSLGDGLSTRASVMESTSATANLFTCSRTRTRDAEIVVQPITVILSVQDLSLLSAVMEQYNKAAIASGSPGDGVPRREDVSDLGGAAVSFEEKGRLSLESVRIVIVDDAEMNILPVCDAALGRVSAKFSGWSGELEVSLTSRIELNSYNAKVSAWEPLIEPWPFVIRLCGRQQQPPSEEEGGNVARKRGLPGRTISLESESSLEVLLVHHAYAQFKRTFRTSKRQSPIVSREMSNPFVFGNFLPMDISICAASSGSRLLHLQRQHVAGYAFDNFKLSMSSRVQVDHTISLAVEGEGIIYGDIYIDSDGHRRYHPICGAEGGKEGESEGEARGESSSARTSESHSCPHIYVHSFLNGRVRHVDFRERFMLHNRTGVSIVLTLEAVDRGKSFILDVAGRMSIPAEYEDGSFYMVPEGERVSEATPKLRLDEDAEWSGKALVSSGEGASSPLFCAVVTTERFLNDHVMDVYINAPICVENLLPAGVHLQVVQGERKGLFEMAENGRQLIRTVDCTRPWWISVSIPELGFFSSNSGHFFSGRDKDIAELSLENEEGQSLRVMLCRAVEADQVVHLTISAFYVIVNQTNMKVQVRSSLANKSSSASPASGSEGSSEQRQVATTVRDFTVPPLVAGRPFILFSHAEQSSSSNSSTRKRIELRVADSTWSKPVSLDAIGAQFQVDARSILTGAWYNVGISESVGTGRFAMTKVVYIAPRYVIVNECRVPICLGGASTMPSACRIEAQSQGILHIDPADVCRVTMCSVTNASTRSASFDLANIGQFYLRPVEDETSALTCTTPSSQGAASETAASSPCAGAPKEMIFRISRSFRGASLYVTFALTEFWPFQIHNETFLPMVVGQCGVDMTYMCEAHSRIKYAWDEPMAPNRKLLVLLGNREHQIDPTEIGARASFRVKFAHGSSLYIDLSIVADGPAVIVMLRQRDGGDRANSRGSDASSPATAGGDILSDTTSVTSGGGAGEDAYGGGATQLEVTCSIPIISISVIGPDLEEFLLFHFKGLRLCYSVTELFVSYGITIRWLQIDNQSFDWEHPTVLCPTPPSRAQLADPAERPFARLLLVQARDRNYGVTYYKYFGALMQEFSLDIDERILQRVLAFFSDPSDEVDEWSSLERPPSSTAGTRLLSPADYRVANVAGARDTSDLLFFETFQMHPFVINFTFTKTQSEDKASGTASVNPLSLALDVLTMTVGNVSDAPLTFNALILQNVLARKSSMQDTLYRHYRQQAVSHVHLLLGSVDVIGNPIGLVTTLGSGIVDLFYEPYLGFISDNPADIGLGLARGGASLIRKTISGFSGTFSKITGSMAKGLSAMTMDSDYQKARRTSNAQNRPRHALAGVATGLDQFVGGITSGVVGIFEKPIECARDDGVGGFFKGVGLGLVGAITKPLIGTIDMTSSVTEGIKNSAASGSAYATGHVRFPRVIPHDGVVKRFSVREAYGQSSLAAFIGASQLVREQYVVHVEIPRERSLLILTSRRLLLGNIDDGTLRWEGHIRDLLEVGTEQSPESSTVHIFVRTRLRSTRLVRFLEASSQELYFAAIVDYVRKNNAAAYA